jgi:hypothetical protein
MRNNNSYSSLEEIIVAISGNEHASLVWVGKNYSKQDLIDDLERIQQDMEDRVIELLDD